MNHKNEEIILNINKIMLKTIQKTKSKSILFVKMKL